MTDYDITDRYGAVMLLKVLIQSMEKDMNEPKNAVLKGSYEILIDLFKEACDFIRFNFITNH